MDRIGVPSILLDGVHLGGDGAQLLELGHAETVGLQAFLQGETVTREGNHWAVHSREIPPEVAGSVCSRYFFGIHCHRIALQ